MRIKWTFPDHSGVVQLGALRQVEVEEVTQTAEAEGGHKVVWLQFMSTDDLEPLQPRELRYCGQAPRSHVVRE